MQNHTDIGCEAFVQQVRQGLLTGGIETYWVAVDKHGGVVAGPCHTRADVVRAARRAGYWVKGTGQEELF